jgi:hypothetical protein
MLNTRARPIYSLNPLFLSLRTTFSPRFLRRLKIPLAVFPPATWEIIHGGGDKRRRTLFHCSGNAKKVNVQCAETPPSPLTRLLN